MPVLAVVGAHALCAELMSVEIILKLNGLRWTTCIIHMTRGERGNPTIDQESYGKQLENEMEQYVKLLGSQCIYMSNSTLRGIEIGVKK
jgi:hypothetical protein